MKTEFIVHRVNEVAALQKLDPALGVEIDVRSSGDRLILAHDPFVTGESLDQYLKAYASRAGRGVLIVNTKEDGLEGRILDALRQNSVERFFFLDLPIPTMVRLALRESEKRVAVRFSEYEPLGAAEPFAGAVEWVWVDCFTGRPPSLEALRALRRMFRVCLVSPELQKYPADRIADFKPLRAEADAICTKFPERWS